MGGCRIRPRRRIQGHAQASGDREIGLGTHRVVLGQRLERLARQGRCLPPACVRACMVMWSANIDRSDGRTDGRQAHHPLPPKPRTHKPQPIRRTYAPWATVWGWMRCARRCSASRRSSPQSTATEVVPSPTSSSLGGGGWWGGISVWCVWGVWAAMPFEVTRASHTRGVANTHMNVSH